MTVQQLIDELRKFPAEMQVYMNENHYCDPFDGPVKEIKNPDPVVLLG